MQRSTQAFLSAALLSASLATGSVFAQAATPAAPPAAAQGMPAAPSAIQPSDAQLQKFAMASQKVAGVADEYRPKLQAAKDDAQRQEIISEADDKMVELVKADGLTVAEFNGIGQAVQEQPALKERVVKLLDGQARGG